MNTEIRLKLSLMMFLEFFIWGAWFVTLGTFLANNLNASGTQTAAAFSTQSFGAIIAPFIVGLIADKYINAEKILGILHFIGAILMYLMFKSTSFDGFYPYVLAYMIVYMPTLAMVNTISFNQMKDPEKEFSTIRVFGTLGWIISGLAISYLFHWDSSVGISLGLLKNTFLMGGVASLALGFFSFILPSTPPKMKKKGNLGLSEILGFDALKLLYNKDFLVFFISSIFICIPLAFYYQNANVFLSKIGMENPTGKMTIGQISEVFFMLLLPIFFKKFGFKKTLFFGMLAWVLRYVLFAYGNSGDLTFMLISGIALHGICYDFFFVSGQIYTDSKADENNKGAAQGLITFATYGLGMLIGFWIAGIITDFFTSEGSMQWNQIWLVPAGIAVIVTVFFITFFNDTNTTTQTQS